MGEIRDLLRMGNWDIVLHADHLDEELEAHAETWAHENAHVLNIRLDKDFFDLPPGGIRNTVIHELTHAQHRDVGRLWDRAVATDVLPKTISDSWDADFHAYMERFVSWVADTLESSFPLYDPYRPVPRSLPRGVWLHSRHS